MVPNKRAVTKCSKNQVFIVPQIRQKTQDHLPSTNVKNHYIERVNTMKFVGVFLDDNLSWKGNTKNILKIK